MKLFSPNLEFGHLLIGNLKAALVDIGVELAFHGQACCRCSGGDEVDDDLMADEWFATPVLANEREKTVFDLVPFAGTWWKVTNRDFQPGFVGQLLQLPFP